VAPADRHAGSRTNILVGDNEPYDGALRGDTMFRHCMETGLAHALIEVRQDLIGDQIAALPNGMNGWRRSLHAI
jgi:predicted N-formylglutamate amidohydrolase